MATSWPGQTASGRTHPEETAARREVYWLGVCQVQVSIPLSGGPLDGSDDRGSVDTHPQT